MAENEIEEMLHHLRRIKSQGILSTFKIDQIKKLEMVLRSFRTIIKYHHDLRRDPLEKLTKKTFLPMVIILRGIFDGIPDECKTNLHLEKLESHLLEFLERDTILSYNYELNAFDLSKYMDCLVKNLHDVLMMLAERTRYDDTIQKFIRQLKIVQDKMRFLRYLYATEINGYVDHEKLECLETRIQFMADDVGQLCLAISVTFVDIDDEDGTYKHEYMNKVPYLLSLIVLVELEMKKIFLSELKAPKFTQSTTFKDEKLPKGFSRHLHSLLVYLRNKKLENFPNNISAQTIDVAIDFLLVFLDADVSNHICNDNWLNEVMEKVGAIAGDVLYVIQKLLPASSINKDDTSKISLCSIQILERTKDLKAQVEMYYKSLEFTPSQFPTFGGLSFLDSLLRKLNEWLKSKYGLDFLMKPLLGDLEKEISALTSMLEKELSSLSSIFIDVAKVHHEHKILKNLQRRTINLAYEAEIAIDSILSQYNAFLHTFCSLPTIFKETKQINAEVTEIWKQIKAEMTEIWSVDVALKPHFVVAPSKHLPTRHSNPATDEEIVGFGNATEKMIQYLISGTNELDVVPIVGMGGQGKTTIARMLYDNDIIVSRFDVRAWSIISQTYNQIELLQEIFSQVTGSKDKEDDVGELADKLRKRLMVKRYLIVLDDMWDGMAWDDLRLCFPDVGNRSRIVITTRLENVGEQVKYHTDPYYLPFLTTEESCQLMQKKVFQKEYCPPELQYVIQAVAEKCKGLPLVVVLVAGIIRKRKMEESWWNEVKDALFDHLDRESEEYSLSTMQLSFDNLPDCLKPCLLYMGMFPEDAKIPVSKLISLWIAEGFVQNVESGRLMEEAAEDYLMDLISRNLVMALKRAYNGKVKYCQVHDVVLHFCLEKSRQEKFMLAVKGNASKFKPLDWKGSRVSISFNKEACSKTQKPFHQYLRSLIMTSENNPFDRFFLRQISELRLLKVLDLSSYEVYHLSSATFKPLNYLKYLAVWADKFYFHPESHLPLIETLIVNHNCNMLLPATFWEMKKLRYVGITEAVFDKQGMFEGSSKLDNLRILGKVRFSIDEADRLVVLSQRCPNLQQLHIDFEDRFWDDSAESFCLKLENLTQLQILHLSFGSPKVISGLQLPSNLKMLVLFGSHKESMISFVAGLPSLEYLCLQDEQCYDQPKEWCLGDIMFHKLKLLKLVRLDISMWDVSGESFPLLETLVIKECGSLEEIPLNFADIPTLKQIKLIGSWKVSLNASAVKIKEDVEENEGNDRIDLIRKLQAISVEL